MEVLREKYPHKLIDPKTIQKRIYDTKLVLQGINVLEREKKLNYINVDKFKIQKTEQFK